ncbi:GTP cyclohydrolase FolE2 [Thauera butanivorans]|uniref:GTP cyclohydrolase FolE2 n=1 Tax=Thauera butanivorans TaxID=86174 RepID=UPI000837B804|nr:GTP cyclohydrolase FolE2 [Thauera butanivorans]
MNAPDRATLMPDVQSQLDGRDLPIHAVGVKGLRYPATIRSGAERLATVATLSLTVGLAAHVKGTLMSRFVELMEEQTGPLDQAAFKALALAMLDRLEARRGTIEMRFPYFVSKTAPVSGVRSLLDYEVCWQGSVSDAGEYSFSLRVLVPATSLCPCSKGISDYGAHNQRSHIGIEVRLAGDMLIEELIAVAEESASCEVYGLLKRPDEKFVTERAYDNPKFVEDLVRDVALALNRDRRLADYVVEAENFESIHNHSSFARIVKPVQAGG